LTDNSSSTAEMTASRKQVLLVAHDRGGVNLLVPLLVHWQNSQPGIDATFLSTPMIEYEVAGMSNAAIGASAIGGLASAHAAKSAKSGAEFLGRSVWTYSDASLTAVLESKPWDLVLTGTSLLSGMERAVWELCRAKAIPCAAMCDMWTEYRRRFSADQKLVLPDFLLVLDERMEHEARAELGDAVRTKVVGSSHFAHLIRSSQQARAKRTKLRFISEPIAELFPAAGVHEFEVAETLIGATRNLLAAPQLVLRPHPQDDSEGWRRFAYNHREQNVRIDDEPSWACHLTTKMAIGMSSMMLIELAIAGVPVASFQPPGSDKSYYCLQESEFGISIVEDAKGLAQWLASPPEPRVSPQFLSRHRNAIEQITDLILSSELVSVTEAAR
jgi:hypothetical protein